MFHPDIPPDLIPKEPPKDPDGSREPCGDDVAPSARITYVFRTDDTTHPSTITHSIIRILFNPTTNSFMWYGQWYSGNGVFEQWLPREKVPNFSSQEQATELGNNQTFVDVYNWGNGTTSIRGWYFTRYRIPGNLEPCKGNGGGGDGDKKCCDCCDIGERFLEAFKM